MNNKKRVTMILKIVMDAGKILKLTFWNIQLSISLTSTNLIMDKNYKLYLFVFFKFCPSENVMPTYEYDVKIFDGG